MGYKVGDTVKIMTDKLSLMGSTGTISSKSANGYTVLINGIHRGFFLEEHLKHEVKTNRQWLESLSDRGLAEFFAYLTNIGDCEGCPFDKYDDDCHGCVGAIEKWLNSKKEN